MQDIGVIWVSSRYSGKKTGFFSDFKGKNEALLRDTIPSQLTLI